MALLLHGTTRQRAERIALTGPNPNCCGSEGFSTYLESGPFLFGSVEDYACQKAAAFPDEGGAAIISMDVPQEIVELAVDEYFPLTQGLIQFDGQALVELCSVWPRLWKAIRTIDCP
jgi:hypothetical protein